MKRKVGVVCLSLLLLLTLPLPSNAQSGRMRQKNSGSRNNPTVPPRSESKTTEQKPTTPAAPPIVAEPLPPVIDDNPIKLDTTLVSIPVVVSQRNGAYVPNLIKKDFTLYEDSLQQEIAFFNDEETPFNLALLIDTSGSVTDSELEIKNAAIAFTSQLHAEDKVMVISFADEVRVQSGLTNNRLQLRDAIQKILWGGNTRLYDAIHQTVDHLKKLEGRKAIVLLSDGVDTASYQATYRQAIKEAGECGALVYVVRYPSGNMNRTAPPGSPLPPGGQPPPTWPPSPFPFPIPQPQPRKDPRNDPRNDPNDPRNDPRRRKPRPNDPTRPFPSPLTDSKDLSPFFWQGPKPKTDRQLSKGDFITELVEETAGDAFETIYYRDIDRFLKKIAEELRHVYVLGYYPTNPKSDGRFRKVNVQVTTRQNVAVRYKRGYNAPKQNFVTAKN